MLDRRLVEAIIQLLQEGQLSQRKIAARLGVSRGTVHAVARGKRHANGTSRTAAYEGFVVPEGPVRRCPDCGGRVMMPCLACWLRKLEKTDKVRIVGYT